MLATSHPPPKPFKSNTLGFILRVWIPAAVRSLTSAAFRADVIRRQAALIPDAVTTGMSMCGKMSVGVRAIVRGPTIKTSRASNVLSLG